MGGGGGGATGLLNKGGDWLPGLVTRQAVEFPQVLASLYNNTLAHGTN